jgi:3-isopropylmalate dehydrogenase
MRRPWDFDVIATENLFGDILSDLGAGLVGGMGFAPSADIGDDHAMFQPSHGSAPDIAGQGKANPTAMLLSVAMMLDWLGTRHGAEDAVAAGRALDGAVARVFAEGRVRTPEQGGSDGTAAIARAVLDVL